MRKIIVLFNLILLFGQLNAQDTSTLTLGLGTNSYGSDVNNSEFVNSDIGVNLGFFTPLLKKEKFNFGLNLAAVYRAASSDFGNLSGIIPIHSREGLTTTSFTNDVGQSLLNFGVGPQFNLKLSNKFWLSPILQVGYFNFNQDEVQVTQENVIRENTFSTEIFTQDEVKENGLFFNSALRLNYQINKQWGVWAGGNYFLANANTRQSTLIPFGGTDDNGEYDVFQVIEAASGETDFEITERETSLNNFGVNFGIAYSLGGGGSGGRIATYNEEKSKNREDNNNMFTDKAAPFDGGEILKIHTCPINGYKLIIVRPQGYPEGSSERVIQVEKINKSFYATWQEIQALITNYPPNKINYTMLQEDLSSNAQRYCNRNGYMIPIDTNVYSVSLVHSDDYNGVTSVFSDNNLETAPLHMVISIYNQKKDGGDTLPNTCNYGCNSGSNGVIPDTELTDMVFGGLEFNDTDSRDPDLSNNRIFGNNNSGIPDIETPTYGERINLVGFGSFSVSKISNQNSPISIENTSRAESNIYQPDNAVLLAWGPPWKISEKSNTRKDSGEGIQKVSLSSFRNICTKRKSCPSEIRLDFEKNNSLSARMSSGFIDSEEVIVYFDKESNLVINIGSSAICYPREGQIHCSVGKEQAVFSLNSNETRCSNDEGILYCWGNNNKSSPVIFTNEDTNTICEDGSCIVLNNRKQGFETLGGLHEEKETLSNADQKKILEKFTTAVNKIKSSLERCEADVCRQVSLNADGRKQLLRQAEEDSSNFDRYIVEVQSIVREDIEALERCETEVCRRVLSQERQLLSTINNYLNNDFNSK